VSVAESVGEVERRPVGLVGEVLVSAAVLLERRRGRDGGRVDDALHRAGPLALPEDDAHRVHYRLRRVLVLQENQEADHYILVPGAGDQSSRVAISY